MLPLEQPLVFVQQLGIHIAVEPVGKLYFLSHILFSLLLGVKHIFFESLELDKVIMSHFLIAFGFLLWEFVVEGGVGQFNEIQIKAEFLLELL